MSRPQFEQTTIQAPKKSLQFIVRDQLTPVAAGQSEMIDVYSDAKTVARLVAISLKAPAPVGATTGKHYMTIGYTGPAGAMSRGMVNWNIDVDWNFFSWVGTGTGVAAPDDIQAQIAIIRGLQFDSAVGLRITYVNDTDVANNGQRNYRILIEKEEIA